MCKQWKCLAALLTGRHWQKKLSRSTGMVKSGHGETESPEDTLSGTPVNAAYDKQIAAYGASAAWNLGRWEELGTYVEKLGDEQTEESSFLRAVLAIYRNDHDKAFKLLTSPETSLSGV